MNRSAQDLEAWWCTVCGERDAAEPTTRSPNRTIPRPKGDLRVAATEHGCSEEVMTLTCADLHEYGGVDPLDTVTPGQTGRPPTCPFQMHVVGGGLDGVSWAEVRRSPLLSHWSRGCWTLQVAATRAHGTRGRGRAAVQCLCCQRHTSDVTEESSIVLGWHHAAMHHPGDAVVDGVLCRRCRSMLVTVRESPGEGPSPVPPGCRCEDPTEWGRRYLP